VPVLIRKAYYQSELHGVPQFAAKYDAVSEKGSQITSGILMWKHENRHLGRSAFRARIVIKRS